MTPRNHPLESGDPTPGGASRNLDRTLRDEAEGCDPHELPALLAALEAAKATAWQRLMRPELPARPTEALLTAEELAPLVGLAVHAVRDRARRGVIPSVRLGHYVRFVASEVIAALKAQVSTDPRIGTPAARKIRHKTGRLPAGCPPSVQQDGDPA